MTDRTIFVPGTEVGTRLTSRPSGGQTRIIDTGELVHTAVAFLVPADFVAAWRAGGPQTSTGPACQAGPAE